MGDNDVLASMTAVRFDVMGVSRSYLDFYLGFGWTLSVFLLLRTRNERPRRRSAA